MTDRSAAPSMATADRTMIVSCRRHGRVAAFRTAATAVWLCLLFAGCGSDTRDDDGRGAGTVDAALAREGEAIFRNRDFGEAGVACADCHADVDDRIAGEGPLRAGHSIVGAATRTATWNGEYHGDAMHRTAAGAAKCARIYQMRGDDDVTALSEHEAAALMAFYTAISTGNEPSRITWTALAWPGNPDTTARSRVREAAAAILSLRADADRGAELFDRACAVCHGPAGLGVGPSVRMLRKHLDELPVIVRSGHENMPFYAPARLTDQDVADIRAYVDRAAR